MGLTIDEILEKLELEPPADFFRRTVEERYQVLDGRRNFRGVGRTTAMLVNVVHRCQWNNVIILGFTPSSTSKLVRRARMMAVRCGIDPSPIIAGDGAVAGRGVRCEWFADHTVNLKKINRRTVPVDFFYPSYTEPGKAGTLLYLRSSLIDREDL